MIGVGRFRVELQHRFEDGLHWITAFSGFIDSGFAERAAASLSLRSGLASRVVVAI